MNIKVKLILIIAQLSVLSLPVCAAPTAGAAPSGKVTTCPDTNCMGVGMTMDLSATELKDNDCKEGEVVADSIDPSSGVKFEVSGGSLSSATSSTPKLTLPTTKGDVTITLKVKDKGTPFLDAKDDFLTGGTKTITVRTPTSVEEIGAGSTITSPVFGGRSTMQIKDEDGNNFTVADLSVGEASTALSFVFVKDGVVVAGDGGNAAVGDDEAFTSNASGQFSDNIGKPLSDLTAIATASNAQNTLCLVVKIKGHEYAAKIGTTVLGLTNKYDRDVSAQIKKLTPGWGTDTQNHSYVSTKQ